MTALLAIVALAGIASTLGVLAWAKGAIANARAAEHEALSVADVQTENASELRKKLDLCLADFARQGEVLAGAMVELDKVRVELRKHETSAQRLGRLGRL